MAAAAILGIPAETSSETFWVTYIHAAISYLNHYPEMGPLAQTTTDEEFADLSTEDVSSDPQKEEIDQIDDDFTIHDERLPGTAGKRNEEANENEETMYHDKVQDIFEEQLLKRSLSFLNPRHIKRGQCLFHCEYLCHTSENCGRTATYTLRLQRFHVARAQSLRVHRSYRH